MEYSIYGFQFSISAKASSDKIIRGDLQVHLHGGVGSDSPLRKKTYMHLSEELATRAYYISVNFPLVRCPNYVFLDWTCLYYTRSLSLTVLNSRAV